MSFRGAVVICSLGLIFVSQQALGETMPRHHAGFFATLAKDFFADIDKNKPEFDEQGQVVLDHAAQALEDQRLNSWSVRPFKIKGGAKNIADRLGLSTDLEKDRDDLTALLGQNDPNKRKVMVQSIAGGQGSDADSDPLQYFQDARNDALKDLENNDSHNFDKELGLSSVWDMDTGMYRSVIGKADAQGVEAGDIILMGETKFGLDTKNPDDLEVRITPVAGESVMVLTPEKIKELQKHIYGKWKRGEDTWLIEAADKGAALVSGGQYVDTDPIGLFPFSKNAVRIKVTVIREDGTQFSMRNAYLEGLRIKVDHEMDSDDKQDVNDLPEWVIDDVLSNWFPGQWFDLKVIPAPNPRDMVIEVDMWRMHVTYTEGDMFGGRRILKLHDSYTEKSFALIRHHEIETIPVTLQFVDYAGKPFAEDIPFGDKVRVEATFKKAPEEDMRDVELSWDAAGLSVDWVQVHRSENEKIYYSEPFVLEAAKSHGAKNDDATQSNFSEGRLKL